MNSSNSPKNFHIPVMLQEVLKHWYLTSSGFYIDCTFGRGGHSRALLKMLDSNAFLLGIDIDPSSREEGELLSSQDNRFQFINSNYSSLYRYWILHELPPADAILFDLGFSTSQLNDPNKTFSYNSSSSGLELRYGVEGTDVYKILNDYSERKLVKIFKTYGEISNAEKLVQEIVRARVKQPIKDISQLKEIAQRSSLLYSRRNKNPLKLIFQALRIECNNELANLKNALSKIGKILKLGGKLLIITFNSLEDEVVLEWSSQNSCSLKIPDLGLTIPPLFKLLPECPLLPGRSEIEQNWSARSAKLWVFIKTRNLE